MTSIDSTGFVTGCVCTLLRLQGAAVLAISVAAYAQSGQGWGLFPLLFLLPDIAFLAYPAGPRAGTAAYTVTHAHLGASARPGHRCAGRAAAGARVDLVRTHWL